VRGGDATANEGEGREVPENGQLISIAMVASASSEEARVTISTMVTVGRTSGERARCRRLEASGVDSF
jgi:hypothetical protein